MDKAEYQNQLVKLNSLVEKEDYEGALGVVETIDWRRVKSVRTLTMVADVYEANKRYPEAKKILLMAYDRTTMGKTILYRLVEVAVKMKDFDSAEDYYSEFEEVAHNDNSRYLLKYKILKGRQAPYEEQIDLLEEYKELELTERWSYELALLYSKAGNKGKCVETCDDLILWFSEGKYVTKAMELKMQYEPLTPSQQKKYENRFLAVEKEQKAPAVSVEKAREEATVTTPPAETQESKAVPEEKKETYTAPTYLGSTIDLHAELAKSIRDVFSVKNRKEEEEEEPVAEETAAEPESIENLEVKELEPERLDVQVTPAPNANTTIKTRPEPKAEAAPKEAEPKAEPEAPASESASYEDLDLEALFQETAGSLSEEISGQDTVSAKEIAEAVELPLKEAVELPSEEAVELPPEEVQINPEDIDLEIPEEPKKETVTDATIQLGIEKTLEATLQNQDSQVPEGTVPMSIEEVLRDETPEETRIRILNDTQPDKLSDEQKALFTYFAKVPGMDQQILDAMHGVYYYAGDKTSHRGNIAIMGGYGTGKTRLSEGLVRAICADLKIPATKMARMDASDLNKKDPAKIVAKLAGGFLLIERAGLMYPETIDKLSRALDFRTDSLVLIIEDEKVSMRGMFSNYPEFAEKFETVISIPVFTNDELVTFARTYARENGYRMDEMGVLALYTQIGDNQKEGQPMTITQVKEMVDRAISHAQKGTRRFGRKMSGRHTDAQDRVILYEKDFEF